MYKKVFTEFNQDFPKLFGGRAVQFSQWAFEVMKIVVNLLRKSANLRNGIRISIGYIPVGENNQRVWDEKKV